MIVCLQAREFTSASDGFSRTAHFAKGYSLCGLVTMNPAQHKALHVACLVPWLGNSDTSGLLRVSYGMKILGEATG